MLYNKLNLAVAKIASTNDSRPELASVLFTKDKTAATDSFRLIEITVDNSVRVEDYPKIEGKDVIKEITPFLVSAKALKEIKPVKSKTMPILNYVAITFADDKQVEFSATNLETVERKMLRKVEGTFPEYEKVIPTDEPKAKITLNANYLLDVLAILAEVNKQGTVEIEFYEDGKPLLLKASNGSQSARALVMPLKP